MFLNPKGVLPRGSTLGVNEQDLALIKDSKNLSDLKSL